MTMVGEAVKVNGAVSAGGGNNPPQRLSSHEANVCGSPTVYASEVVVDRDRTCACACEQYRDKQEWTQDLDDRAGDSV